MSNSLHNRLSMIVISLIVATPVVFAQSSTDAVDTIVQPESNVGINWTNRHAEGWFWRQVDPEPEEPEKPEEVTPTLVDPYSLYPDMNTPLADPLATLETLQQAVEVSKARAVLQPTEEHLMNWIRVQNELLVKNSLFADRFQRVVWENPQYDYTQVRPTNPVALAAYSESYNNDRRDALRRIATEYGLYFVVAENCAYCHAMSPYLKRFADTYDFTVISVSVDGGTVPEFPTPMYSPEFADKLGVKTTPAIILAKPSQGVIQPIAYGFISLPQLEARIYQLFELEPGQSTYKVPSS